MGIIGDIAGTIGSLTGLFGGGQPKDVQLPPQWTMPNMTGAAGGAYSGIQNLAPYTNLASSTIPYAQNTFSNLYNNPYAGTMQTGANVASGLGENAALGAYGTGQALTGAGLSTIPYAQSIMQTGFDPQSALYNRTAQQLQDQTRAAEAARGIQMTPYGAGIEGQTMSNFNIDWQNNLLNRQIQAAGGAGGLLGQGGSLAQTGTGITGGAPGQFAQAAGMPFGAFGQIGGAQNQAINQLLVMGQGAQNIAQQPIGDYLNYVGVGNQAASVANQQAQLALAQAMDQQKYSQLYGGALGSNLYNLGRDLGWGGSGNPFSTYSAWGGP